MTSISSTNSWFEIHPYGEVLPYAHNRVTVGDSGADRYGVPLVKIDYRIGDNERKMAQHMTYTAQGTGGTQYTYASEGYPPPVLSQNNRAFGSVLNDAFLGTYPTWTAGVQFAYPLGRSAAKASLAEHRLQLHQQDLNIKDLEIQIGAAVRNAARAVQTNFKRVEATQKALTATERQLDAEQRKFGVGLSSAFELQQRQRDLATARINELNATIDYNRALITLERVQKIQ